MLSALLLANFRGSSFLRMKVLLGALHASFEQHGNDRLVMIDRDLILKTLQLPNNSSTARTYAEEAKKSQSSSTPLHMLLSNHDFVTTVDSFGSSK